MQSVRIVRPGEIGLFEEDIPTPKKGEALIRMRRAGICGTDHNIYNGEFQERVIFPLRPGHEWAGTIAALGEDCPGFSVGENVTGEAFVSCGVCPDCVKGEKYACKHKRSVGTVNAWDGAMSEYFVFPVRDLMHVPDCITLEEAALIEPTSNALMAVEQAEICPGSRVAIMGTGPIGIAAVAIARIYGATTVICVGRSEFKLDMARRLGATHVINSRDTDVAKAIMEITCGEGVDATLEISGAEMLFRAATQVTRYMGHIVLTGFYEKPFMINVNDLIFPLFNIHGSGGGWGGYAPKVMKLMTEGVLKLAPMVTHRCTLAEAPDRIVNLKKDNAHTVKVMICAD